MITFSSSDLCYKLLTAGKWTDQKTHNKESFNENKNVGSAPPGISGLHNSRSSMTLFAQKSMLLKRNWFSIVIQQVLQKINKAKEKKKKNANLLLYINQKSCRIQCDSAHLLYTDQPLYWIHLLYIVQLPLCRQNRQKVLLERFWEGEQHW